MPRRFPWPYRVGLIVLTAVAAGLVALPADAATSGVVAVVQSTVVEYPAANGRANNVVITRSGRTITIDDTVSLKPGTGCAAVSGDKTKVRCTTRIDPTWVRVYLRDGNDSVVNKADLSMAADGGTGNDRLTGGPRGDSLLGNDGTDAVWGLGGNDRINAGHGSDALSGGDGNDWVEGGPGNDRLFGGAGHDQLLGMEGNDVEDAGPGTDTFAENFDPSGPDADSFIGGEGEDTVSYVARNKGVVADADGVKGDDGTPGEHDTIGTSVEAIQGGDGNDRLLGTPRRDTLLGGRGDDVLAGSAGNDILGGQGGRDYLNGAGGDDLLIGDDPMFGGPAADTLIGGPGRDRVDYSQSTAPLTIDLDGSANDDGQRGERDTIGADVEDVTAGLGNDRITGNAAANEIYAGTGADVVLGGTGNDVLHGEDGTDQLSGGAGDDQLLSVNDLAADRVDGGADATAGGDICQADPVDVVANCERDRP